MAIGDKHLRTIISAKDETTATLDRVERKFGDVKGAILSWQGAVSSAAAVALAAFGKAVIATTAEFQKLQASLVTVTGSTDAAAEAFEMLKGFAATTPFQLDEVVRAFIKMQSLGLNPTEDSLRSFGNTAAAMGKDLNQFIEAVADAATGEFERLKEFGIKAKSEGDRVSFTFQNVTTTIGKNATEITQYLEKIGNTKFADGMANQMNTIDGAVSNLRDAWEQLKFAIGEPSSGAVAAGIRAVADAVSYLGEAVDGLGTAAKWAASLSVGEISLWEWIFTGGEGAERRMREIEATGSALTVLRRQVQDMESDKAGNFWWTKRDEDELQAARSRLADLERMTMLQRGLETANMPPKPQATTTSQPPAEPDEAAKAAMKEHLKRFFSDAWTQAEMELAVEGALAFPTLNIASARSSEAAPNLGYADFDMAAHIVDLDAQSAANASSLAMEQQYFETRQMLWWDARETHREIAEEMARDEQILRDQKMQAWESGSSAFMNVTNALYTFSGKKSRQMFELNKMAGIANAVVSTASAATKALDFPPGPPISFAYVAAAIASGAAQIAAIQSQTFGGKGSPAPAGGFGGGTPHSPVVTQPVGIGQGGGNVTIILNGAIGEREWFEDNIPTILQDLSARNINVGFEPRKDD